MIKLKEVVGLPSLQYHIDNGLSLHENVYRYSSEAFIQLFAEARQAWKDGNIQLNEEDEKLLETTDIGEYGDYNGMRVPLDLPMVSPDNKNALFEIGCMIDEMIENEDTIDEAMSIDEMIDYELIKELPRSQAQFEQVQRDVSARWVPHVLEVGNHLTQAVKVASEVRSLLARFGPAEYPNSKADMNQQLRQLFDPERLIETPVEWLTYFPRYLKAVLSRAERLPAQGGKDDKSIAMLVAQLERLNRAREDYPGIEALCPQALRFRWMLEEFRVSLFAQQLGTKLPVSVKRLDQQWQSVETWMIENPR